MDYKEFCENADIEYVLLALVDGQEVAKVTGYDVDSVSEQAHKLENAISQHLTDEFYSRAEYAAEESEGLR